ncbi:leucine-rich repeat domain-containing protein [Treponema phagedenis]|uniref:leucine-rich repeat domain-containing protein n=1 Tax=Treponema phagedenis TaxID=162 RepID=UPI0011E835B6|nr:leucine-rich repeat domain-containing protein [Treponema phagedenis]QEK04948.1 leucine-rich repeat domain-containing protein [Treponema phagedenis]QEK10569.1 leucine-rich repeat domain-containing protein [Treponema phagedenis]
MMKNSSIVKKGLMQIHKSLLVAVLAFAALGILGGLTACHEQPITPSGGSAKTTPAPTPLKNFITTETNGALTITGYDGELPKTLVIPEKIDEKPVVGISKDAFTEKTSIQKVIFPKSLKTIETGTWNSNSKKPEGAFSDCTNLTELDFSKCTELTSIGRGAFSGCSGITALTLPEGLQTIGNGAFFGCTQAVITLQSITKIDVKAFGDRDNTTSLCKAVRVPNSTIKQMVEDSQYTKNTDKNNPPYIEVYTP